MSASARKIRALVVDDEAHARTRLRQLLLVERDIELVAECANGREAVEGIQRHRPDLVFLDVQMPRLGGFEVCQTLLEAKAALPLIVFVTAHDQYALKAFEIHALDYLLKPFDSERFRQALDHVRAQMRRAQAPASDSALSSLLQELRGRTQRPERLVFKQNGGMIFIQVAAIDWVEADGNYIKVQAGATTHHVRETLASIEAQLPQESFLRLSRSTIVNLDRVKELKPLFYGDCLVLLQDGSRLKLSRNYRERVEALLARQS